MVKLHSKQGKEILATIEAAILNGDIGDIFTDDFDISEVDWVQFRLSNSTWESKLVQRQFREACQRLITKLQGAAKATCHKPNGAMKPAPAKTTAASKRDKVRSISLPLVLDVECVSHFWFLIVLSPQKPPVSAKKAVFRTDAATSGHGGVINQTASEDSATTIVSDVSTPAGAEKWCLHAKSTAKKLKKQVIQANDEKNALKTQLTFALETNKNQSVTLSNQSVTLTDHSATIKDQQSSIRELTTTLDSSKQALCDTVGMARELLQKKDRAENTIVQTELEKARKEKDELEKKVAQLTVDQEEEEENHQVGFFYQP